MVSNHKELSHYSYKTVYLYIMAQLYLENFYQFWLLSWNSSIGQFVHPVGGNRVKVTYIHLTLIRVNDYLVKDPKNKKYIFKFNVWICFAFFGCFMVEPRVWTSDLYHPVNFQFFNDRFPQNLKPFAGLETIILWKNPQKKNFINLPLWKL